MDGNGGGKKRVKSENGDGVDRISALPDHLKEYILERVSIKDAMKTSVLSSEWRYCWTGIRKLDLIIPIAHNKTDVISRVIDRILLRHKGPIRECKLALPYDMYCNRNLSDWFHVLSNNGVEDILIECNRSLGEVLLPSSFFHCRDLKKLKVFYCKLSPPPGFIGFPNLLSLEIDFCTVSSLVLGSLISECPLLEKLSLMNIHILNDKQPPLVINALNLKAVYFRNESLGSIIFGNVPRLTHVQFFSSVIFDVELDTPRISWTSICSLSGIMVLEFDMLSLEPMIDDCPSCLPTRFEKLKTLTLSSVNVFVRDDVRFMFCLIKSSPGLENLTLMADRFPCKKTLKAAAAYLDDVTKEEIKTSVTTFSVNIGNSAEVSLRAVLALTERVVSCSPTLEKLLIKTSPYMKEPAKLRLSRRLMRFGRYSSKLKIIHSEATYYLGA